MNFKKMAMGLGIALLTINTAQAELFGLLNGRSANPATMTDLSVEAGAQLGDIQNFGARVNYKVSDKLVAFGDFGLSEVDFGFFDADGTTFGFGAFFFLADQRILQNLDVSAKASYHQGNLEVDDFDFDVSNISIEVLVSSQEPISANGLRWYANGGFNIVDFDFDNDFGGGSDTELLLGGGVYLPLGGGEAYAGIDLIDEIAFGAGFRYFVQ